ncbi:DUF2865 domain-containing protein [Oricola sp.]|uniref:DUF2865 domain-containing protein n=1 Tax=Oricola sp. TaxID=1979950 RepID=UPI0025F38D46|nr:DUF2865 domain-containing protein [Oricola sp.]MCI5077278.1 DUF2865 domain-containing protein [Oricola sp.]
MPGHTRFNHARVAGLRMAAIAVATIAFALPALSTASADVCSDLRRQLREASQIGSGARSQVRRYAEAAIHQREEIEKTISIRRSQNCDARPSAACLSLDRTIRQMRINLDALQRQRDRLSGGQNAALIRAIENRLDMNRCDDRQRVARQEPQSRTVTVIPPKPDPNPRKSRIIVREGVGRQRVYEPGTQGGSSILVPDDQPEATRSDSRAITVPHLSGSFRTLCVRTCDGYYFPISFSTAFDYFERDAQACAAMCPATEAKLYFHRVPDQESEEMISLQGQPYTALPTAFLYRKTRTEAADPSCTCRVAQASANAQQSTPSAAATEIMNDANLGTEPEPAETAQPAEPSDEDEDEGVDAASRSVRVVGPEFLPAPEAAIDLLSPDRTSDR